MDDLADEAEEEVAAAAAARQDSAMPESGQPAIQGGQIGAPPQQQKRKVRVSFEQYQTISLKIGYRLDELDEQGTEITEAELVHFFIFKFE